MTDAGNINIRFEAAKSLVGKFLQAVFGFVGIAIFARLVDKSNFGGFYFLMTMVTLADRPLRGFDSAVGKRWSEVDAPKQMILGTVLIVNLVASVVIILSSFALSDFLISQTNLSGAPHLFVLLLLSITSFSVFQSMLNAEGFPAKKVWNDTLRSIFTFPLQLLFVLSGFGAMGMGYGLAAATILTIPTAFYFIMVVPRLPDKSTLISLWNYTRYSIPSNIVGKVYDRFDVLLLGLFIGTTVVANYEVAFRLTVPAAFVGNVVGTALQPKVSNLYSKDASFGEDVQNSLSFVSILAIPIFFGALTIPDTLLVTVFGEQYGGAGEYLIGLALYQLISSQTGIYGQTISGVDKPELNMRIGIITLLVNVILGVILLFKMGALGVIVATVIAESVQYLLKYWYVSNMIKIDPVPRTLWTQIISGAVMAIVVERVSWEIVVRTWVDLGLLIATGVIVYSVSLIFLSPQFRVILVSIYRDFKNIWARR